MLRGDTVLLLSVIINSRKREKIQRKRKRKIKRKG
jgi:hypothetical protein